MGADPLLSEVGKHFSSFQLGQKARRRRSGKIELLNLLWIIRSMYDNLIRSDERKVRLNFD